MPGNVDTFVADVSRWVAKAGFNIDKVCRESAVTFGSRVIDRTPLEDPPTDDIVARGDWNTAVGSEPGDDPRNDPSGEGAKSALRGAANGWKPSAGGTLYFANHKPYIGLLEYGGYPPSTTGKVVNGHSSQAPNGMVRVTAVEWPDIVDAECRKVT